MDKAMMLESVEKYLSRFGEDERKVLGVMSVVDRKNFVDKNYQKYAYFDEALPTEEGQTISQSSTVARMLQLLDLKKKVLEIGGRSPKVQRLDERSEESCEKARNLLFMRGHFYFRKHSNLFFYKAFIINRPISSQNISVS
ncbi:MAG: hypothetical protein U9Q73_02795 [Nanoarchaeota archaeon]|nr:hypothetical protein [Nanoarchaeota archaeon]